MCVQRNSWGRYLSTLKQHPGSINAVSEYMYEINYDVPANWSLAHRVPYALNFSKAVQALSPKVHVTPVRWSHVSNQQPAVRTTARHL
jgi:hypothetical protein